MGDEYGSDQYNSRHSGKPSFRSFLYYPVSLIRKTLNDTCQGQAGSHGQALLGAPEIPALFSLPWKLLLGRSCKARVLPARSPKLIQLVLNCQPEREGRATAGVQDHEVGLWSPRSQEREQAQGEVPPAGLRPTPRFWSRSTTHTVGAFWSPAHLSPSPTSPGACISHPTPAPGLQLCRPPYWEPAVEGPPGASSWHRSLGARQRPAGVTLGSCGLQQVTQPATSSGPGARVSTRNRCACCATFPCFAKAG